MNQSSKTLMCWNNIVKHCHTSTAFFNVATILKIEFVLWRISFISILYSYLTKVTTAKSIGTNVTTSISFDSTVLEDVDRQILWILIVTCFSLSPVKWNISIRNMLTWILSNGSVLRTPISAPVWRSNKTTYFWFRLAFLNDHICLL